LVRLEYLGREDLVQVKQQQIFNDSELDSIKETLTAQEPSQAYNPKANASTPPVKGSASAEQSETNQDESFSSIDSSLSEMRGDAPSCDVCGHITIRNGTCYKCLNCGNSLGCS